MRYTTIILRGKHPVLERGGGRRVGGKVEENRRGGRKMEGKWGGEMGRERRRRIEKKISGAEV